MCKLKFGGPNKLEDEVSLSCSTQDKNYEIDIGVACVSSLNVDELYSIAHVFGEGFKNFILFCFNVYY